MSIVPLLKTLKTYLPVLEMGMIKAVFIQHVVPLPIVQFAAIIIYNNCPRKVPNHGEKHSLPTDNKAAVIWNP
jgi:hypothetical protein